MTGENMKVWVYNYDPTERFYLGKERATPNPATGTPLIPANATLIPPPARWRPDYIPVFKENKWEVVRDNFWRPKFEEINFDAGRELSTYNPLAIYINDFPLFPSFDRLTNSLLVTSRLVNQVRFIDLKFMQIIQMHKNIPIGEISDDARGGTTLIAKPPTRDIYKFECETLVFQMRQCLDTLCRLTELLVHPDRVNRDKRFKFDSVGRLFRKTEKWDSKDSLIRDIVIGAVGLHTVDSSNFLKISNDLFNAIKHTHMLPEAHILHCEEFPSITAFSAPRGSHDKIIHFHNHNAYHLVMGFQDTVKRIAKDQYLFRK